MNVLNRRKSDYPSNEQLDKTHYIPYNISHILGIFCGVIISLVCSAAANAQSVPGYLGKRTYFEYNLYSAPTILGINQDGEQFGFDKDKTMGAWSFRHHFSLNYVTKRNAEIGGSISTAQTGIVSDLEENTGVGEFRFTSIGIHRNRYFVKSTGALAPLGRYFKMDLQYLQTATFFDGQPRLDHHLTYFGAGLGTRMIFKNRITVNASFQSGLLIALPFNRTEEHQTYRPIVRKRLQQFHLYEANLGIGILLF